MPQAAFTVAVVLSVSLLAFGLAVRQSLLGAKVGTDHAIHAFLIRAINANGRRLFVRIPRLLNNAYCAALPLYLHWCFAHFRPSAMYWAERLLNPVVNMAHTLLFGVLAAMVAAGAGWGSGFVMLATALFALTPQFYHALSARTFGLSARGIGLFLLTGFLLTGYWVGQAASIGPQWALLIALGYLIWAFSTFGAQALVIISLLLLLLTGRAVPAAGMVLGLALFIVLHPRYSLGYLRHTLRFVHSYAVELAPIYILNRRYSIWRDLVWDIWAALRQNPAKGLRYAYENSVLVVAGLNPFLVVTIAALVAGSTPDHGLLAFASDVALSGAAATFLTSFRKTRFLGEPERYAEAVTPWATAAGGGLLFAYGGIPALAPIVLLFLALDLAQLRGSRLLNQYVGNKPIDLSAAQRAIEAAQPIVRCCSNNEQLTKLLMVNDWDFAYCIAVGEDYCEMRISEAFSRFPYLRRDALERIIETYRINACVLDRSEFDSIFDVPPPGLREMRTVHETEGLRVLALDWDDAPEPGASQPRP